MNDQRTSLTSVYAEWAGDRQNEAVRLVAVLDAADTLASEDLAPKVVLALLNVARAMAEDLSVSLDFIHLPQGDAA